jgi:hypothetical protein
MSLGGFLAALAAGVIVLYGGYRLIDRRLRFATCFVDSFAVAGG